MRSNNLKSISPDLDLGGGLTVAAFDQLIAEAQAAQADYNQSLAVVDEKANNLDDIYKRVNDMSARLLAGVGARYGKNSNEYEKAGGSRTDEIKRTSKKAKKDGSGDKG